MSKQNKNRSQDALGTAKGHGEVDNVGERIVEDVRAGVDNLRERGREGDTDMKSKARNKR